MANNPTPAQIAAGLSEAMRRALLWLPADGSVRRREGKSAPRLVSFVTERRIGDPDKEIARVYRLAKVEYGHSMSRNPDALHDRVRLTPLGQAVRAAVLEMERDHAKP